LVACLPLAAVTTLLALPLWRWLEARFGIEAVGHSGPADWCYEVVYALWVVGLGAIALRRKRRRDRALT
jgi:MYXO-CTERM domain-containing protein